MDALRSETRDGVDADDELARAFPGCSFTHVLTVVSRGQLGVTMDILTAIQELAGDLDWLRLTRVGEKLEHRLRLTGLSPAQARLLSNRLDAMAGIERAIVEHQILRLSEAAGGTGDGAACDRVDPSW